MERPQAFRFSKRALNIVSAASKRIKVQGPDGTMRELGMTGVLDALAILYGNALTAEAVLRASRKG
jgi:hypothetical protein